MLDLAVKTVNKLLYGEDPIATQRAIRAPRASLLARTDLLISRLRVDEETKVRHRERAEKYFSECGCTLGALFLIGSVIFLIFDRFVFSSSYFSLLTGFLFAVSAALIGKLLGIGIGRLRLFVLFRKLSRSPGVGSSG